MKKYLLFTLIDIVLVILGYPWWLAFAWAGVIGFVILVALVAYWAYILWTLR